MFVGENCKRNTWRNVSTNLQGLSHFSDCSQTHCIASRDVSQWRFTMHVEVDYQYRASVDRPAKRRTQQRMREALQHPNRASLLIGESAYAWTRARLTIWIKEKKKCVRDIDKDKWSLSLWILARYRKRGMAVLPRGSKSTIFELALPAERGASILLLGTVCNELLECADHASRVAYRANVWQERV